MPPPKNRRDKIFISYRREDTSAYAGRMVDLLTRRFGEGQVFIDLDSIPHGTDFVRAIEEALGACRVFVPVIGREWLTATDSDGRRRLDDPEDFVRAETAAALKSPDKITVIPVLVGGASMPRQRDLPPDIRPLVRMNAVVLNDDRRWRRDVEDLVASIEQQLPKRIFSQKVLNVFPKLAVVILILVGVGFAIHQVMKRPQSQLRTPSAVKWAYDSAQNNLELSFPVEGENNSSGDADILYVNTKLETATQPPVKLAEVDLEELNCMADGKPAPEKLYFKTNESIRLACSPRIQLGEQGAAAMRESTPLRITVEFVDVNRSIKPMTFCLNPRGEAEGRRVDPQCMNEEL